MSQRFYVYFLINKYLHHYLYFCAKLLNSAKKCTPYSFGNIYLSKKCPKTHQGLELLFALSLDISRFYCTAKKKSFPNPAFLPYFFLSFLRKSGTTLFSCKKAMPDFRVKKKGSRGVFPQSLFLISILNPCPSTP